MRNGNSYFFAKACMFEYNVLILPMRNGNHKELYKLNGWRDSSYPTYEEWKHP